VKAYRVGVTYSFNNPKNVYGVFVDTDPGRLLERLALEHSAAHSVQVRDEGSVR